MMTYPRKYTEFASEAIKQKLNTLIQKGVPVCAYQEAMVFLGEKLAESFVKEIFVSNDKILLVSTSEDADYLTTGYVNFLRTKGIQYKLAVFWNHHYSLSNGTSVAPITQRFLQDGYQSCNKIVLLKSIISGSCVIRTNLLALLDSMRYEALSDIFVVAPVMHNKAEESLKKEFPESIVNKFQFITFAIDEEKDSQGNVLDGIGGEVYGHLGLESQPAKILGGYTPKLVEEYLFA